MLENPFKPITSEEDTDPAANADLVGKFLGAEAQAVYEKLNQGREGKKVDDRSDLTLTDAEKAVVQEARENEIWGRDRYIEWAETFGRDKDWVDEAFAFNPDGTVECKGIRFRDIRNLTEFPPNLTINGDLVIRLTNATGLVLPKSVSGTLHLAGLTNATGLTLPQFVGGDLYLARLTTPHGLILPERVVGSIYISQTDLNAFKERFPQYAHQIKYTII